MLCGWVGVGVRAGVCVCVCVCARARLRPCGCSVPTCTLGRVSHTRTQSSPSLSLSLQAEDRTDQFVRVLERELKATREMKDEFVRDFSLSDYDALISGWEGKMQRCAAGDQKWGLFSAHKSA